MNENQCYYNFMNLNEYFNMCKVKGSCYSGEYLKWFKNIASTKISMFSYENLPRGLTTNIIEMSLFFNNNLCLYKSPTLGLVLCKYMTGGEYDIYRKPIKVNLIALNGKPIAYNIPYEDIVLVRDNSFDIPPFLTANARLDKIMEQEKTLTQIIQLCRLPTILSADKSQTAVMKQVLRKIGNFEPFAIANKGFKDHIEQFDIKLTCDPMTIYELMDKYKDLTNASIGVYSTDEKRERIVTAEIQANNDEVDFIYNDSYEQRLRFVNECNKKFGTKITLKESYVNNREDEIKLMKEQVTAEENAKAEAQIKVEKEKVDKEGE